MYYVIFDNPITQVINCLYLFIWPLREPYRRRRNTFAYRTRLAQWIKGGVIAASFVGSRSAWMWEWSKKVSEKSIARPCYHFLLISFIFPVFRFPIDHCPRRVVVRTASLKGRRGRLPSKPRSAIGGQYCNSYTKAQAASMQSLSTVLVRANLVTQPSSAHIDYSMVSTPCLCAHPSHSTNNFSIPRIASSSDCVSDSLST